MNRRLSREEGIKLLYQMSINKCSVEEALGDFGENYEEDLEQIDLTYMKRIISGVYDNMAELDGKIEKHLVNWKMSRISKINLAILRACTYEIVYDTETPAAVFINEAVEIAKKYSEDKSVGFINGVLDRIAKKEGRI
ncbi:MAG: transcription antitermination factor NusB [Bacillota bacterium]|nr:transcription antitermination factor NusB [Bacillota bacterium]